MAKPIQLEFRISHAHRGRTRRQKIHKRGVKVHKHNPYWSYARHLPPDWDKSKIDRRMNVADRLLYNLRACKNGKMDLSPLLDDQRVSGYVYGRNPLQNMYDIIVELAKQNPSYAFFVKWGGYKPELPDKRFMFYVEDEADAGLVLAKLQAVSSKLKIETEARHQLGLESYTQFVTIGERLESEVRDPEGFGDLLSDLFFYPHFHHHLFLEK